MEDLLICRGVVAVPGVVFRYDASSAFLRLDRAVDVVFEVRLGTEVLTGWTFTGRRELRVVLPETRILGAGTVAQLLESQPIRVMAQVDPTRTTTTSPVPLAYGMSSAPQLGDGRMVALQRAMRFLLMSPSPLQPQRGGGLGGLRHVHLESEGQVQRIAQLACERFNASSEAGRSTGVSRVSLVRVLRSREGDATLQAQFPGVDPGSPVIYVVHLLHMFRDASLQTAVRL